MKLPFKKIWLIPIAIIIILIIGNPGKQQFKDYLGVKSDSEIRKKYNFLIFSIWTYEYNAHDHYTNVYLGIAFNFFQTIK